MWQFIGDGHCDTEVVEVANVLRKEDDVIWAQWKLNKNKRKNTPVILPRHECIWNNSFPTMARSVISNWGKCKMTAHDDHLLLL